MCSKLARRRRYAGAGVAGRSGRDLLIGTFLASNVAGFFRYAQWSVVLLWPVVHFKATCYRMCQSKHSDQTCPSMTLEDADSPHRRVDGRNFLFDTRTSGSIFA